MLFVSVLISFVCSPQTGQIKNLYFSVILLCVSTLFLRPCYRLFLFGLAFFEQLKEGQVIDSQKVLPGIERPGALYELYAVPKVAVHFVGQQDRVFA